MAKGISKKTDQEELIAIFIKERASWGLRPEDKENLITGNIVVFVSENWPVEYMTPDGLPDGNLPRHKTPFVSVDEMKACDIYGNPIDMAEVFDWFPDEDWEDFSFGYGVDEEGGLLVLAEESFDEPWRQSEFCEFEKEKGKRMNQHADGHRSYNEQIKEDVEATGVYDEYDEDEYAFDQFQKMSPWIVSGDPRYEIRKNTGCLHGQKYKNRRKGGGRLSRREARTLEVIFEGATTQLFVPPRVAIINGSPENLPLTRRHRKKRLR